MLVVNGEVCISPSDFGGSNEELFRKIGVSLDDEILVVECVILLSLVVPL